MLYIAMFNTVFVRDLVLMVKKVIILRSYCRVLIFVVGQLAKCCRL